MASDRKIDDLIDLIHQRYPDWNGFDFPEFVADEITYKRATIHKAAKLVNQVEFDQLLGASDYDTIINRLIKSTRGNNLLWQRVPSSGDTAVLHHPHLDKPSFCTQIRNLLYGDRPSPQRLQTYSDYLNGRDLPNKWPLPTYFLFLCHPETDLFVKPRTARWFWQYMGNEPDFSSQPTAVTYQYLLTYANELLNTLRPYGAEDMVDVQSFIWVCAREGRERTGRLDVKGQVDLDVPPTQPLPVSYAVEVPKAVLREKDDLMSYPLAEPTTLHPLYPLSQWAAESGYDKAELERWVRVIQRKGQVIFYGPPGTGKTYSAEKLAQHLMGGDQGLVELVQFHPAYAYEDFVQGIRPRTTDGVLSYEWVNGRFLDFCHHAAGQSGISIFIIDEINRANLSSVLGELMYLLEYRDRQIPLAGGGLFSIPDNVYLIGTMNTADRSIALVDHALRRRFAFIHLHLNEQILHHFHQQTGFEVKGLIPVLQQINGRIGDPHYAIGHTYFLREDLPETLPDIWQMEVEPYLEEYFYSQPDQIDAFRWGTIKNQI